MTCSRSCPQRSAMVRVWRASGEELSVTTDELREYMAGESWPDDPNVGTLKHYLRAKHGFPVCLQEVLQANSCLQAGAKVEEAMELQLVLKTVDGDAQRFAAGQEFEYYAIGAGRLDVARFLLEAGLPALFLPKASREGQAGIVDLLLKSRADVDAQFPWASALHEALKSCHGEVAEVLLNAGANKDAQDSEGRTALHLASENGLTGMVACLLKAGADKDVLDDFGLTPLHYAARNGEPCDVEIAGMLLQAGASKDVQDLRGNTALHRASRRGHTELVDLLLKAGVNSDVRNRFGFTALDLASDFDHAGAVDLLERRESRKRRKL